MPRVYPNLTYVLQLLPRLQTFWEVFTDYSVIVGGKWLTLPLEEFERCVCCAARRGAEWNGMCVFCVCVLRMTNNVPVHRLPGTTLLRAQVQLGFG